MSASQPALFNVQEFTDNGVTLVGGRLYTYAYGTTAQKIAYTDPEGTVPQTYTADGLGGQYIALNARGELPTPLYLTSAGSYDISLKRADGSTVWTRKADGTASSASLLGAIATFLTGIGASLIGYIAPGAGAILQTIKNVLDHRVYASSYGMSPTATAEKNLAALNANKAAIEASGLPGVIRVPAGYYSIAGTFTFNPLLIQLQGEGGVTLDFSAVGAGTGIKLQSGPTAGESISRNKMRWSGGFTIKGISGASGTLLLDMKGTGGVDNACHTIRGVCFDGFKTAIQLGSNSWQESFQDCSFTNGTTGFPHINELSDADNVNFGECNKFINNIHSGVGIAFRSRNYNADAHFDNPSFDCEQILDISRGPNVSVSGGHTETAADMGVLYSVDGDPDGFARTRLRITNHQFVLPNNFRAFPIFACGVNYPVTGGGVSLDGINFNCSSGFRLPSDLLISGNGPVRARDITSNFQFPLFAIAQSLNETKSGDFEGETFAQTDFTSTTPGFDPTIDPVIFYATANSLRMTANANYLVGAKLTKQVRPGQHAYFKFQYKLSAIAAGASFEVVLSVLDAKGGALIFDVSNYTGTIDWTLYVNTVLRSTVMPAGADTLQVVFQVRSNGGSGFANVDKVVLNIID